MTGHDGLLLGRELLRLAADALLEFDQILQSLDDVEVVLPGEQAVFEDAEVFDERFLCGESRADFGETRFGGGGERRLAESTCGFRRGRGC
jgi:hypothetical protein